MLNVETHAWTPDAPLLHLYIYIFIKGMLYTGQTSGGDGPSHYNRGARCGRSQYHNIIVPTVN